MSLFGEFTDNIQRWVNGNNIVIYEEDFPECGNIKEVSDEAIEELAARLIWIYAQTERS